MRLWRLEFGLIIFHTAKRWAWDYDKGLCGCRILSLGKIYLTWLGNECYFETLRENKDESSETR